MIGTLTFVGFIAAGVVTAFVAARYCLRSDLLYINNRPETLDYGMSAVVGAMCGLIWPVTLCVALFAIVLRRDNEKRNPALRMAILDERERRISDLERELGIK